MAQIDISGLFNPTTKESWLYKEYKKQTMAQQTVKLYTKEMFLIAAEKCEVSMIDAKHIMKYIDEYVRPIELPIDEEINVESEIAYRQYPSNPKEHTDWKYGEDVNAHRKRKAFIKGAKWMRDKILNQ